MNTLKMLLTLFLWGLAAFYIFEFLYGKDRFDLLTALFMIVVFLVSQGISKLYAKKPLPVYIVECASCHKEVATNFKPRAGSICIDCLKQIFPTKEG